MIINAYHILENGKLFHRIKIHREDQTMPLPKPRDNETKKDFLDRCMGEKSMVDEYDDEKQRYAICNSQWDNRDEERTANEHECRLKDPADFQQDSFRTTTRESDGKEYNIIMGRLKNETTMTEQAYRYKDSIWSTSDANTHCKDHDGKFTQSDESRTISDFRGAIRVHHTATSEDAWDAGSNEKRLRLDATEFYYRKAYGWQDPDGEEDVKESYKFIHHEVTGDGNVGPASVKACQAGIDNLNRGRTKIPSGDKTGVYRHLAAHLADAEVEPAPLKPTERAEDLREVRTYNTDDLELRVVRKEGQPVTIEGYAIIYDKLSEDLGFFREKIAKGAATRALKTSDARALFNHDPNWVLGRESSKTLILTETDKGVYMKVIPPDTQSVRDRVLIPIERRDIREQSFGFNVSKDSWDERSKVPIRTVEEMSRIWDVSPVTFAAYEDTDVVVKNDTKAALRSLNENRDLKTGISPDGGGGSNGGAEPKHGAPIGEKVDFFRNYLKGSKERSRKVE